jgi:hypothetical protein
MKGNSTGSILTFTIIVLSIAAFLVYANHKLIDNPSVEEYKTVQDLYIMHSNDLGLYKIGRSIDPARRIREVIDDNGVLVRFEKIYRGMGYMEPTVHNLMRYQNRLRIRPNESIAREWFELDSFDLISIDSLMGAAGYDFRTRKQIISQN